MAWRKDVGSPMNSRAEKKHIICYLYQSIPDLFIAIEFKKRLEYCSGMGG
jgi:hypothetical protein